MGGGADLDLYSTRVGACDSGVATLGRSENGAGTVSGGRKTIHL